MSRVVSSLLWLLRSRAARAFLVFAFGLWAFDTLIWAIAQRSFFMSVGLESWFWRLYLPPLGLFAAFFALCWAGAQFAFWSLAPLERETAPPLRGILGRFEPLRSRILRISRALTLVLAALLARDFARRGPEWNVLQFGGRVGFDYLGLDASVWTRWLPLWMPFLLGLWKFCLALGFLTGIAGILRALPILAQRNNAPPALSRVLWRIGAALLAMRALLYASQTLDLPRGAPLSSGDVWVLVPLYSLGALWCGALSLCFARRVFKPVSLPRGQTSRAIGLALAAGFLPALLGALSWPLRAVLPESAALKWERERATRAAWHLPEIPGAALFKAPLGAASSRNEATAASSQNAASATAKAFALTSPLAPESEDAVSAEAAKIERTWPVWDEAAVLATRPSAEFRDGQVVEWKKASLALQNGVWSAILVGQGVDASTTYASREVYSSNSLALEQLDLSDPRQVPPPSTASPSTAPPSTAPPSTAPRAFSGARAIKDAFYGLEGRSLFGLRGGINLNSPGLKWAWAWRERDVVLPVDAARAPHLLTLRGARERALALAPWLSAMGEARLGFEGLNPVWTLDLCALSRDFPGAMRGQSGEFAGANSVAGLLQMHLDARSGAVSFAATPDESGASQAAWRAAYPGIAVQTPLARRDAGSELGRAQLEILDALRGRSATFYGPARAANASGEPVWRVFAVARTDFEWLESAAPRPIWHRAQGDLSARLLAISNADAIGNADAKNRAAGLKAARTAETSPDNPFAFGQAPPADEIGGSQTANQTEANGIAARVRQGQTAAADAMAGRQIAANGNAQHVAPENIRMGEPFVWRDSRAPGGFWVGRAFFAIPRAPRLGAAPMGAPLGGASLRDASHPPVLWRVALTGLAPNSAIGIGDSVSEALRNFRGRIARRLIVKPGATRAPAPAPLNSKAPPKRASLASRASAGTVVRAPLEEQVLQTHRALLSAIQRGDWNEFGSLNKRQTTLLERLVKRRRALDVAR